MAEEEKESSLSDLFNSAKSPQENLDALDSRSEDFKSLLASTISTLERCSRLVDQLALFSTNEDLDDISTTNIQYLSIDYLLAELIMKGYDPSNRLAQLNRSSELLGAYLTRLNDYNLLSTSDRKLFESYKDSPWTFRIVHDKAGMEAKRNVKIKRFQDEKTLKSRLKGLREQSQQINVDDEVIRNLYVAELQLYVHNSFQSLDVISQERQILASMPSEPNPAPRPPNDSRQGNGTHDGQPYSDRLDPASLLQSHRPHRGILDSSGRPLQPFTITNKRADLRSGVFRPGHTLPTMSIDEYLEEERRRGGIIEGGGPASGVVRQLDEDDERAQDEATRKAREWDEFVEANPKGAGNTLNRG